MDLAQAYMHTLPPWRSPIIDNIGSTTPSSAVKLILQKLTKLVVCHDFSLIYFFFFFVRFRKEVTLMFLGQEMLWIQTKQSAKQKKHLFLPF